MKKTSLLLVLLLTAFLAACGSESVTVVSDGRDGGGVVPPPPPGPPPPPQGTTKHQLAFVWDNATQTTVIRIAYAVQGGSVVSLASGIPVPTNQIMKSVWNNSAGWYQEVSGTGGNQESFVLPETVHYGLPASDNNCLPSLAKLDKTALFVNIDEVVVSEAVGYEVTIDNVGGLIHYRRL